MTSTTAEPIVFELGDGGPTHLLTNEAIDVYVPRDPDACGCQGCSSRYMLLRVEIDGYGSRVLCADHAEELVFREVGGE